MTDSGKLKKHIIEKWLKTYEAHPSYQDIADEVGCTKSWVAIVINNYKRDKTL